MSIQLNNNVFFSFRILFFSNSVLFCSVLFCSVLLFCVSIRRQTFELACALVRRGGEKPGAHSHTFSVWNHVPIEAIRRVLVAGTHLVAHSMHCPCNLSLSINAISQQSQVEPPSLTGAGDRESTHGNLWLNVLCLLSLCSCGQRFSSGCVLLPCVFFFFHNLVEQFVQVEKLT